MFKLRDKKIWITADTHYGHTNICKGVSKWDWKKNPTSVRDFDTLDDMNSTIVNNINAKVGFDDYLIHVGDWSFGGFDNIKKFRDQIVCQNIILILGNHDHHILANKGDSRSLFTLVSKLEEISISKHEVLELCHYPMLSWFERGKGTFMLHGHRHSLPNERFGDGKIMDVGLDGSPDFSPYNLEDVLDILNKKDIF